MPNRVRFPFLVPLLLLLLAAAGPARAASQPEWEAWVLRIDVVRNDGRKELGTGVLVAPGRLLTNCHVVRNASQIRVSRGEEAWTASTDLGDAFRDLCLLKLAGDPGTPAPVAEPEGVGQSVYAVGYSDGRFSVSKGNIKGLFTCACDNGRVIQTSAKFNPGASGGGLFNERGELIGVLTFKTHSGGMFHFAIPVGWMQQLTALLESDVADQGPFWESRSSGYFLAACDLSDRKRWQELARLALEWVREDPYNPQAWMALGRGHLGLQRLREAAGDFRKVLELDPTHAEALWELQNLELDLDESLTGH